MQHKRRSYRYSGGSGESNPYKFGNRKHTSGDINFGKILVKVLPWAILAGAIYFIAETYIFD